MTRALSKLKADVADIGIDIVANLLSTFAGEDAQITATDTHVGTDTAGGNSYQDATRSLRLALEDVAEFLLDQAGNFILTGCLHNDSFFDTISQSVCLHLLEHRKQSVATGRREMFTQSDALDEIEVCIQYLLRRMVAENANE